METNKFLIKVNDFGNTNMEELKGDILKSNYFFHMHQLNDTRLDGECRTLNIDCIRDFALENSCDLTVICYDVPRSNIVKTEVKYGFIASKKAMIFNEDLERKLIETKIRTEIEDFTFRALYELLSDERELTHMPQPNSKVKINLLCDDEDVLDWYDSLDSDSFVISDIDYKTARVFVDNYDCGIDINHITVLNV